MSQQALPFQFGKYELVDRIGTGGMAEIYLAKVRGIEGFERLMVVKKILPAFSDNRAFIKMLVDEAKMTSALQHPNIVQIYELGEVAEHPYIAMEYVHGKDLLKILARCVKIHRRVPLKIAMHIVAEVCKGLAYAHSAKDIYGEPMHIVHRDVSPSNIITSYQGEVKIMDFGVARARKQSHRTRSGVLKGKLGYMSPEQVLGRDDLDHRSDIFSLGIILYETITLKRLFLGQNDLETLTNIRDVRIEHKLAKHNYIPEPVATLIRRALARLPRERFQSAMEFYDDIQDFLYEKRLRVRPTDVASFVEEIFDEAASAPILVRKSEDGTVAAVPSDLSAQTAGSDSSSDDAIEEISLEESPFDTDPGPLASGSLQGEDGAGPREPARAASIAQDLPWPERAHLPSGPEISATPGAYASTAPAAIAAPDNVAATPAANVDRSFAAVHLPRLAPPIERQTAIVSPDSASLPPVPARRQRKTLPLLPSLGSTDWQSTPSELRINPINRAGAARSLREALHGQATARDPQAETTLVMRPGSLQAGVRPAGVGPAATIPHDPAVATVLGFPTALFEDLKMTLGRSTFRLQDAMGNVFGPVTFSNLLALIQFHACTENELISIDGGEWRPAHSIREFADLCRVIEHPENVASMAGGEISHTEIPRILVSLWQKKVTGKLKLLYGTTRKEVYFRQGLPQYIASSLKGELLGAFLISRKVVAAEQIEDAVQRMGKFRERLGDALIALNYMTTEQLGQALELLHRRKFLQLFTWNTGRYEFFENVSPPIGAVLQDMDLPRIVTDGVREFYGFEELKAYFRPFYACQVIVSVSNGSVSLDDLNFSGVEQRFLSLIKSGQTLMEILRQHARVNKDALILFRVLFIQLLMQIIRFEPSETPS